MKNITSHSFPVELAKKIGINQAIMLQHFYFWYERNKLNEKNYFNDTYWTFNSVEAFKGIFSYWTYSQIRLIIQKLEDDGYILSGNYNKMKYDRTKWYTLTKKSLNLLEEAIE